MLNAVYSFQQFGIGSLIHAERYLDVYILHKHHILFAVLAFNILSQNRNIIPSQKGNAKTNRTEQEHVALF